MGSERRLHGRLEKPIHKDRKIVELAVRLRKNSQNIGEKIQNNCLLQTIWKSSVSVAKGVTNYTKNVAWNNVERVSVLWHWLVLHWDSGFPKENWANCSFGVIKF